MRDRPSILHLDLDAFFASVEQRDKPSLRGRPVIVGGIGSRGVVATASYEARRFGIHSAMSTGQARRLAPHANYLAGRFDAYRESSRVVMGLLHEISPVVEPLSLDEAYVDLEAGGVDAESPQDLEDLAREIRFELTSRTEGLTASVGVASSKFMAKLASERAKPDGLLVIPSGGEVDVISPLPVRVIPGVGPATFERLTRLGIATVADLQQASPRELRRELGQAAGVSLHDLAFARDDRPVQATREAKSISVEDTFAEDLTDAGEIAAVIDADAASVAERLRRHGMFARTITLKVRFADFTTWTRSRTLDGATDATARIAAVAHELMARIDATPGIRLLGVGVSNFTQSAQEELFYLADATHIDEHVVTAIPSMKRRHGAGWVTGMDVEHDDLGRGWVWGAGLGVVTVRFETRRTPVGPVRSFCKDDPALHPAEPLPLTPLQ